MSPERRRRTVAKVRRRLGQERVSERRVCRALNQPRTTQRYLARKPDADRRLITQMRRMVESYPRYGCDRVHQMLVGTGWRVNFKRVHRLWKREHLQVPRKQHKRRRLPVPGSSANSCVRHRATHRNHVWSYDFPAEHWMHLRTTNPIESMFATVRLRTDKTKGCGSRIATLTMVFKLAESAQKRFRRLNGHNLIPDVIVGVRFTDGVKAHAA